MDLLSRLSRRGKFLLMALLLVCVSLPSGDAYWCRKYYTQNFAVTGRYTRVGGVFNCGSFYYTFYPGAAIDFQLHSFTLTNVDRVSLLLSENNAINFPRVRILLYNTVLADSTLCAYFGGGRDTMINYTLITAYQNRKSYLYTLLRFGFQPTPGTRVYISDVTATFSTLNTSHLFSVYTYKMRSFRTPPAQENSGFYISRAKAKYAESFLVRSVFKERNEGNSTEHWDTLSVDNSECNLCNGNFFADNSTNVIENGVIRFQNCKHDSPAAFYGIWTTYNGKNTLYLGNNANLIFSTVEAPISSLFSFTPENELQSTMSSSSRLTVHNIYVKAIFPSTPKAQLFPYVPNGAQVYLGPIRLNGAFVTGNGFNMLNIPYTRVTDIAGKVLMLGSGARAGDQDNSKVGEYSASHCVNNGYSGVSVNYVPGTTTLTGRCRCNSGRFVPICTTSWDPLGLSLCPIDTTLSAYTNQCVNCKIDNCVHCNQPNTCARCWDGYTITTKGNCVLGDDRCEMYDDVNKSKCVKCRNPFVLSENAQCVSSIPNCNKYTDSGLCLECKNNLIPSADGRSCISCTMPGCKVCSSTETCISCLDKYTLLDGKCVECDVEHCVKCNKNNQCAECEKQYAVNQEFSCTFEIPFCKVYLNDHQCAECDGGYTLVADKTLCVTTIDGCVEYEYEGLCMKCIEGLQPSADRLACVKCSVPGCETCDQHGKCADCKPFYTPVQSYYEDGSMGCIECNIPDCIACYHPNVCANCGPSEECHVGQAQDTSKGIPWWVWLIVGLAAAVLVGLIIFFVVWCCCCKQEEYFVTYQERYNEDEKKNGNRDMRLWDRNGSVSGSQHGAVFLMNDSVRPRIYKQDDGSTHGDMTSALSSDGDSSSTSGSSSSRSNASSDSDSRQE